MLFRSENLAAIEIGEFTNDWDADSGSKEIGGEDPAEVLEAVQLADNLGHGGADDSLIERGKEEREKSSDHDEYFLAAINIWHGLNYIGQDKLNPELWIWIVWFALSLGI